MVVPDAENEGDTAVEGLAHTDETALGLEAVGVAENGFLLGAEVGGDGRSGDAGDFDNGVIDDDTVLDVQTADLGERAGGGAIGGDELGHNSELGIGVNSLAGPVEGLVSETVGVEITAIFVAETAVSVVAVTTRGAIAACRPDGAARMRGIGSGHGISLPEIHLGAAGSIAALAGVGIVG